MFFARFAAVMIASFAGLGMVAAGGPGTCDPADPQICVYNGVNMPCGPYGGSCLTSCNVCDTAGCLTGTTCE